MHDHRTVTVNVNAELLERVMHFAAQGILHNAESEDLTQCANETDLRADLGRHLADVFELANVAADAQGHEARPYSEVDVLDALFGTLTSRSREAEIA